MTSLESLLAGLHAERVASMHPADLQVNIDQRAELVASFDPSTAVEPGDVLAPYSLLDVRGGELDLDTLVKLGPAVLIFFRYASCPACNIALAYYRDQLARPLDELGARLVAVSPQVPERLVEIADRLELPFAVASDPGNGLARRLGITFTTSQASQRLARAKGYDLGELVGTGTWELPMPTVLVLDQGLTVRFAAVTPDWMARTSAEPVLAAVRAIRDVLPA
jgi:peroxiredoxin